MTRAKLRAIVEKADRVLPVWLLGMTPLEDDVAESTQAAFYTAARTEMGPLLDRLEAAEKLLHEAINAVNNDRAAFGFLDRAHAFFARIGEES